ncbi:MAG TPA: UDP-3-O-(3-hydroxymyristoyl)glucosamine N-acyltransferase, partial [Burkholderiales bacterium]|nr:UDP-3-O-(3-hydroxymyristoyl)glucosamine N-acyltransferase [Burkholderiales bacterium]
MNGSEPNSYTLREIAERFGGEVVGDAETRVSQVATLHNAGPGTLAFLANPRYAQQIGTTAAAALLVGAPMRDATTLPRIVCEDPYVYFARVSALFNPPRSATAGVHPSAVVDATADIAPDAEIGPNAVIGRKAQIGAGTIVGPGCVIGDSTILGAAVRLHANVTIYENCVLGDHVTVHSGVVIGADGFGIAMSEGRWLKIPQIGRVVIGSEVEIGANTTIDRGAIDDTILEDGVKLDNQIQIAHNVHIGAHTAIAACTGIAGSTKIGRHCRIGGAAGIAGHITIADHVEISGYTAITKSIDKPGVYSGLFPFDTNAAWRRNAVQLRRLSDL